MSDTEERIQRTQLAEFQQWFAKTYRPEDPRESFKFERDLYYLIHLVYREAQAPLQKYLTDWANMMTHRIPPSL